MAWCAPSAYFFKLNFDCSELDDGQPSFGFVIRNASSEVVLCGAKLLDPSLSILVAEAWGFMKGIRVDISLGVKNLVVEGENLTVIQSIKRVWNIPWSIFSLIADSTRVEII